jgi:hypothetical protein
MLVRANRLREVLTSIEGGTEASDVVLEFT